MGKTLTMMLKQKIGSQNRPPPNNNFPFHFSLVGRCLISCLSLCVILWVFFVNLSDGLSLNEEFDKFEKIEFVEQKNQKKTLVILG